MSQISKMDDKQVEKMNSGRDKRVIEKLMDRCRRAYQSKKPLIFIDTEEHELMRLLVQEIRKEKMIDLFKHNKSDEPVMCEDAFKLYYQHITDPDSLKLCSNYSDEEGTVIESLKKMAEDGNRMDSGLLPELMVIHLVKDPKGGELIKAIREYVQAHVNGCKGYVGIVDNASPIRSSCVLVYGDSEVIPKDLTTYTEYLEVDFPKEWEIKEIIEQIAQKSNLKIEPQLVQQLAGQMKGFGLIQAMNFSRTLMWTDGEGGKPLLYVEKKRNDALWDTKSQAIRSAGGILTPCRNSWEDGKSGEYTKDDLNKDFGGMGSYKNWLVNNEDYIKAGYGTSEGEEDPSEKRGIPAMKGVLLCGVPGCGKSEAAKILNRYMRLPMLRMDVDQLMGGLVGESERNMRKALSLAEAMAPCILWIDELDKGFSGSSSQSGDGGTFKRMFGRLLTWLQENKEPCFIFATANDISCLPPEFFRSGRFDELFSVFMPTNDECIEIFKAQMKRANEQRKQTAKEKGEKEPGELFESECDNILQNVMDTFTAKAPIKPNEDEKAETKQKVNNEIEKQVDQKKIETGEGVKFVSGADIQKIVTTALKDETLEGFINGRKPITSTKWQDALIKVICSPDFSTLGSGYANMNEIAACYVRLLRRNFIPVPGKDQQLFKKDDYTCEQMLGSDEMKAEYKGECPSQKNYDKALFNCLKARINIIASGIETNALKQLF